MTAINNVGDKIAQLRKQHGLTQEQLAEKLSISSQAVSKWETGITSPDISLLPEIAAIFFISVDELLGVGRKSTITETKDTSKLMLHVRILSADGDKVNINLPFTIVSTALSLGNTWINFGKGSTNDMLKSVDWKQLTDAVEVGLRGKIVDIQSADGDIVEIVVE